MGDSLEELMFNYALRSEHEADLTQVVPPSQISGVHSADDTKIPLLSNLEFSNLDLFSKKAYHKVFIYPTVAWKFISVEGFLFTLP